MLVKEVRLFFGQHLNKLRSDCWIGLYDFFLYYILQQLQHILWVGVAVIVEIEVF